MNDDEVDALKTRLAEVERERDDLRNQIEAEAEYSYGLSAGKEAAEARIAVLEKALGLALAEHDHRRSMQITLTEPDWVQVARVALAAEQKEAGK